MPEEDKQAFEKWKNEVGKPWWLRTPVEMEDWDYTVWCAGMQYQHEKESA